MRSQTNLGLPLTHCETQTTEAHFLTLAICPSEPSDCIWASVANLPSPEDKNTVFKARSILVNVSSYQSHGSMTIGLLVEIWHGCKIRRIQFGKQTGLLPQKWCNQEDTFCRSEGLFLQAVVWKVGGYITFKPDQPCPTASCSHHGLPWWQRALCLGDTRDSWDVAAGRLVPNCSGTVSDLSRFPTLSSIVPYLQYIPSNVCWVTTWAWIFLLWR